MIAIFPEIAAAAAAGDVERLAILVRRYFGGQETFAPKPGVVPLLMSAGLEVRRLAMDTLGALVAKDERGAFSITAIVSERLDIEDSRFLLAHMLGHYLLDVQPLIARGDWQMSGYRETVCPLKRYVQGGDWVTGFDAKREARADAFAATLLLPAAMVRRAAAKLADPDQLGAFFGVSRPCMLRRLEDLGLIEPGSPVNFLDAERQIGQVVEKGDEVQDNAPAPPAADTRAHVLAPSEQAMPRSYAASTYTNMERSTRKAGRASAATTAVQASASQPPRNVEQNASAGSAPRAASNGPNKPPSAGPGKAPSQAPAPSAPDGVAASASVSREAGLTGMDRIRELARKLDKTADKR